MTRSRRLWMLASTCALPLALVMLAATPSAAAAAPLTAHCCWGATVNLVPGQGQLSTLYTDSTGALAVDVVAGGTGGGGGGTSGLTYNSSGITLSNTQTASLQGDSSGNLFVDVAAGSVSLSSGSTATLNGTMGITSIGGTTITGSSLPVSVSNSPTVSLSPSTTVTATLSSSAGAPVAPGAATATQSQLGGCIYNSATLSFGNGQQGAVQCDSAGHVYVDLGSGSSSLTLGTGTSNIGTVNLASGTSVSGTLNSTSGAPITPGTATATTSQVQGCVYVAAGVTFTNTQQGAEQCDSAGRVMVNLGTALPAGANTVGKFDLLGNAGAVVDGTLAAATAPANGVAVLGEFLTGGTRTLTTGQTGGLLLTSNSYLETADQYFSAQAATTSGELGPLVQAAVNSSAAAFTTAQTDPLQMTTGGLLKVTFGSTNSGSGFATPSTGASAAISPVAIGGFNSTPYALTTGQSAPAAMTTTAQMGVDPENLKATYSSSVNLAPSTGVVWQICGSASKTIRVREITISGQATTAVTAILSLIKTSTAPTGGTTSAASTGPLWSSDAAMSATVTGYTAAPTVGTAVFTPKVMAVPFPLTGAYAPPIPVEFGGQIGAGALILSGTAQCLEISNATTIAGGAIQINETHTEE